MPALLWKSWIESRGRFYFSLAAAFAACPAIIFLFRFKGTSVDYRAYVSGYWFGAALAAYGPLMALVVSGNGIVCQRLAVSTRGYAGVSWPLSLPVRRWKICAARAAAGAAQLAVLLLAASLLAPLVSLLIGRSYPAGAAVEHAVHNFAASFSFFGLAVLLSALTDDFWHDIAGYCVLVAGMVTHPAPVEWWARVLRGEGSWQDMTSCVALGVVLVGLALIVIERREY